MEGALAIAAVPRAGRRFCNLCALTARPIKTSRSINQIESLDDFAHQIAGLRGVLTISNTTAHMAGALGIPCVVVLDNGIVTTWPYASSTAEHHRVGPATARFQRHRR